MNKALLSCSKLSGLPLVVSLLSLTACQSVPGQLETRNFGYVPRTLSASGRGIVNIPKTTSQVRLGVEVQGKTSANVQQQVAERSQAVVELLKSRSDVEKLETTGIRLNPNYSYKDGKQTITGYTGANTVSFKIEPKKTGSLLDEAVKAGATRIDGVTLVASDSAIADAQKQAIKEASEEANKQADAALSALNLQQREIIGIQINGANLPEPRQPMMDTASIPSAQKAPSFVTPVIAGEQQVQASVTLQIRY
ncbi:MAG: SIMPL domain-containing protein [Aphanothece sp. CMT-3BRIN-NPC111]|jgi:hypothetical protein|nr:SIMPL domain-containing protein [Aphanothece sp. CMT-3BRIN-NPC111]